MIGKFNRIGSSIYIAEEKLKCAKESEGRKFGHDGATLSTFIYMLMLGNGRWIPTTASRCATAVL